MDKNSILKKMDFIWWRKVVAEAFGSFCLLFFALGTAVCNGGNIPLISFVCGCLIIVLVYCLGPISGCNLAPTVSLGVLIMGGLSLFDFTFYVIGQTVGGLLASLLLLGVLAMTDMDLSAQAFNLAENGFKLGGENRSGLGLNLGGAIIIEIVMTFFFVFVVLVIVSNKWPNGDKAGIVIGASLTILMAVGLPLTGCGLNPVRTFGPAIALLVLGRTHAIAQFWPFLFAPLIGSALAALSCRFFFLYTPKPKHEHAEHPHIHIDDHHHHHRDGTSLHNTPVQTPRKEKEMQRVSVRNDSAEKGKSSVSKGKEYEIEIDEF